MGKEVEGKVEGGTDQNYYHVPCPHCGEKQKLVFEQLHWDEGKPETAQYVCIHCGSLIDERYKTEMFLQGEWVPDCPEKSNDDTIGFHISSLYSPYGHMSWADIAKDFLASKDNQEDFKTFVNTVLGETWVERGEAPEYKNLYNRREDYRLNVVPDDVCFLVAGCDVQKDRLEIEIVGYCSDKRSYSIDYRIIEGDTALVATWDKLARIIEEFFPRANGGLEMPLRLMAVDSGYNTTHVYDFCRRYGYDRVVPVKGKDGLGMPVGMPQKVDDTRSGKKVGSVRLWSVGSSFLKSELYSWLRLEKEEGKAPPCYCHFPQYDEIYFKGLTAEERVRKVIRGYTQYIWVKNFDRNEPLDCRNYARAAASIVGLDKLRPEQLEAMSGNARRKHTERTSENQSETPERPRRRSILWDN
jgi:phage terminase large subunit GpA-like protein